jgi:hypothetical protein
MSQMCQNRKSVVIHANANKPSCRHQEQRRKLFRVWFWDRCYFFCKFVHILPLDGPTNVPVFMQDARAVSQFAAMLGWLAPADPLQFAAASLHEEALADAMLPRSRSAIVGVKKRIPHFPVLRSKA